MEGNLQKDKNGNRYDQETDDFELLFFSAKNLELRSKEEIIQDLEKKLKVPVTVYSGVSLDPDEDTEVKLSEKKFQQSLRYKEDTNDDYKPHVNENTVILEKVKSDLMNECYQDSIEDKVTTAVESRVTTSDQSLQISSFYDNKQNSCQRQPNYSNIDKNGLIFLKRDGRNLKKKQLSSKVEQNKQKQRIIKTIFAPITKDVRKEALGKSYELARLKYDEIQDQLIMEKNKKKTFKRKIFDNTQIIDRIEKCNDHVTDLREENQQLKLQFNNSKKNLNTIYKRLKKTNKRISKRDKQEKILMKNELNLKKELTTKEEVIQQAEVAQEAMVDRWKNYISKEKKDVKQKNKDLKAKIKLLTGLKEKNVKLLEEVRKSKDLQKQISALQTEIKNIKSLEEENMMENSENDLNKRFEKIIPSQTISMAINTKTYSKNLSPQDDNISAANPTVSESFHSNPSFQPGISLKSFSLTNAQSENIAMEDSPLTRVLIPEVESSVGTLSDISAPVNVPCEEYLGWNYPHNLEWFQYQLSCYESRKQSIEQKVFMAEMVENGDGIKQALLKELKALRLEEREFVRIINIHKEKHVETFNICQKTYSDSCGSKIMENFTSSLCREPHSLVKKSNSGISKEKFDSDKEVEQDKKKSYVDDFHRPYYPSWLSDQERLQSEVVKRSGNEILLRGNQHEAVMMKKRVQSVLSWNEVEEAVKQMCNTNKSSEDFMRNLHTRLDNEKEQ